MAVDIVHAFSAPGPIGPKASLIQASDGNFYGVTERGGFDDCGTIFKMTPSGAITMIHAFDCVNGQRPHLPLVQAHDGNLYGTAPLEPGQISGIAFRVSLGGAFEVIHVFNKSPSTALVEGVDRNFYGGTYLGGIFRMSPSGDVVELLEIPSGGLSLLIDGPGNTMFGVLETDVFLPPSSSGRLATLFFMTEAGEITPLHTVTRFCGPFNCPPSPTGLDISGLVVTPAALYGVDRSASTAFRFDGNGLTIIHDFEISETCKQPPRGLAQGQDGNFYGTTLDITSVCDATLFRMTPDGVATSLHTFNPITDGGFSAGSLLQAADGTLMGLTEETSSQGLMTGTAFALSVAGDFSVLHRFAAPDSAAPNYLIQRADGTFYGTTGRGGAYNSGALFRLLGDGTTDVLHEFSFSERTYAVIPGADRSPTLIESADGNFYGTTFGSGSNSAGTLFRATSAGEYVDLVNFNGWANGFQPMASPIQASDGALYGTTLGFGLFVRSASVYKFVPDDGPLTTLHAFEGGTEGESIAAAVIEATSGALYGTAAKGGTNNLGTVFRMTMDGSSVTPLHSFSGVDGAGPVAPLIQGNDGNFYGTTFSGGAADLGTVFRITPSGTLTVLHAFNGADGANPSAALLEAADGNFYGVTQGGGSHGRGAVFRLTPAGTFAVMHSFDGTDGERPSRRLIQGSDGFLYGTAERGGPDGGGVVFRLFDVSCENTLTLGYSSGTLDVGFHLRSAVPSIWSTWLVAAGQIFPMWSVPIPAVTPAVSFNLPIPNFPHLGYVGVLTILANPQVQAACGDWQIVNTGTSEQARIR